MDLGSPAYVVPFVEIPTGSKMATDLICRATRNSIITPSSVRITRLLFEISTLGCKNKKIAGRFQSGDTQLAPPWTGHMLCHSTSLHHPTKT